MLYLYMNLKHNIGYSYKIFFGTDSTYYNNIYSDIQQCTYN